MRIPFKKYLFVFSLLLMFILIFGSLATVFAGFFSLWTFDTNEVGEVQFTALDEDILNYEPIIPPIPREVLDANDPTAWVLFDMISREEVVVPSAEQTQLPIESVAASTMSNEDVFQMKMKTEPETVFAPDDRSLISFPSTLTFPWSSICKLLITANDGTKWMGSGSIIGPGQDGHGYHVLTAGHCLYDHDHGGWATSVIVIPGYDGAQTEVYKAKPFYQAFVTGARTYTGWTTYADHRYDLAVCTLDRNIGDFTGWMGRATYPSDDPIYTGVLNTAGYPSDLDEGLRMYYDSDMGRVADEYNHWYYMDTYGGQSGSPVWHINSTTSERNILTVHAYGDDGSGSNHGTRLNQAKYDNINTWLSEDTPPVDRPDLCDDGQGWSGFSPTTVFPGVTTFNVYCDVRNFGTSTATSFSVAYYASENEIITSSDYLLGTFPISSVPALTYTDSSWNGVFPADIPPGDYWVGWIIDNENSVTEFDESNNVAYKTSYQLHVSAYGSLEVSPSSGPGGVDVELTGSDYPPSATVTLSYYDPAFDLWNVLDTVTADPSGDITYVTEVPDLRRSGPSGDNAEMYALVSYRSEVGGVVQGYADYSQYLRGMKTVGDQTASGLYGNGTNLAETVQVSPGDSLTLAGKWFHPGVIYVRWDGEAVVGTVTSDEWLDAVIVGTAVANQEQGYFETEVAIPTADAGEHYLSIEDFETRLIIKVNMAPNNEGYLIVRGSNNVIYYKTYDMATETWGPWTGTPGTTPNSPAAAVINHELHLVVRGVNQGQIWHGYVNLDDDSFSGYSLLSGSTPSAPTLTGNSTHLCLVVRGGNNVIYYRFYEVATRTWSDWIGVPNGATLSTPAVELVDDKLHVVVRGSNYNQIWHGSVDLISGSFSMWTQLSGATPSPPVLTSNSTHLCLVVRGTNNVIFYRWYDLAVESWGDWTGFPYGATPDVPAAEIVANDLHVVVRGMNFDQIWHGILDLQGDVWSGWTLLDGTTPSKPVLTS